VVGVGHPSVIQSHITKQSGTFSSDVAYKQKHRAQRHSN